MDYEILQTLKAIHKTLERIADTLESADNSLAFLEQAAITEPVSVGAGYVNRERWD